MSFFGITGETSILNAAAKQRRNNLFWYTSLPNYVHCLRSTPSLGRTTVDWPTVQSAGLDSFLFKNIQRDVIVWPKKITKKIKRGPTLPEEFSEPSEHGVPSKTRDERGESTGARSLLGSATPVRRKIVRPSSPLRLLRKSAAAHHYVFQPSPAPKAPCPRSINLGFSHTFLETRLLRFCR